jgi:hypothetical protein
MFTVICSATNRPAFVPACPIAAAYHLPERIICNLRANSSQLARKLQFIESATAFPELRGRQAVSPSVTSSTIGVT